MAEERRQSLMELARTSDGRRSIVHDSEMTMDFLLTNLQTPAHRLPGRYQALLFAALNSCMFIVVFNDLCTIFYAMEPSHSLCTPDAPALYSLPDNASVLFVNASRWMHINQTADDPAGCAAFNALPPAEVQHCDRTMRHHFDLSPKITTLVSDWNLICGRLWRVNAATTVYFVGVMTGSIAFGYLADRFGRRNCITACYIGYLPLAVTLTFVPYYWLFLIMRYFLGFFVQGLQSVCFVLLMEYCPPRYREVLGGVQGSLNNFGIIVLSSIAYLAGHWRTIQLCLALLSVVALAKPLVMKESLRWLMVHNRTETAKDTARAILKWNKLPVSPQLMSVLDRISETLQAERRVQSNYTWVDCFRTPKIRLYTIVQSFLWFTTLFVYYGISFSISNLSGSPYLNAILAAVAELPACAIAVLVMRRFGRKPPLMAYYGLCGVLSTAAGLLSFVGGDAVATVRTVVILAARFCLVGSYAVVFLFGSELFPTVIRNTAFGVCICCHTAGGVVCPQILLLGQLVHEAVPFLVFGGCCLLSAGLVTTQPETLHRPMPDTIEQVENPAPPPPPPP
ncbi:solute carrier family 22 member 6-A-like [Paramacrobiotus metropolitanus]|uniref:solute carrier family 22 member 6-A-like n=1 Tax=Paramacrobiotus metropolitanus TaxID=2943436 RepID=UPI0024457131|nr:solute carrier family 22 member 6-A-like [Paramacrobiotus metropolitanus]